jgi:hypothetical protein
MPSVAPSTVYVIQQPRPRASDGWQPNLQPATEFGKIEFVFDGGDRAYADPQAARVKARNRLVHFDSSRDYLCWANYGDPACCWIVIMTLVSLGHQKLRFLYWSRGRLGDKMSNANGFYVPIELEV